MFPKSNCNILNRKLNLITEAQPITEEVCISKIPLDILNVKLNQIGRSKDSACLEMRDSPFLFSLWPYVTRQHSMLKYNYLQAVIDCSELYSEGVASSPPNKQLRKAT